MAGSGQRASGQVSGGMRIDNHSFWAGKGSKGSVFPDGDHVKEYTTPMGAGSLSKYEDTEPAIKAQQEQGISKIKGRPVKPDYRN
jgi:hypothetical protein